MSPRRKEAPPVDPAEAPAPPRIEAKRTVSIEVDLRAGIGHDRLRLDWCTFAQAISALADRIPEGCNPAVDIRGQKIVLSWPE